MDDQNSQLVTLQLHVPLTCHNRVLVAMASLKNVLLVSILALGLSLPSCRAGRGDLEPPQRESIVKTDGGKIEVWSHSFAPIQDANLGAALITLERNGMQLPHYSDSAKVFYIREGCARMGLYYPMGFSTNVRHVEKGDVVVVPHGWVYWWHNTGDDIFSAFGVAETSKGPTPGKYTPFHLIGGDKRYGGILHGFSKDTLSQVWDISKDDVKELLDAQEEAAIIKVESEERMESEAETGAETRNGGMTFGDFKYNILDAEADFEVEDGGCMTLLTCGKLPVLQKISMGVSHLRLEPGALFAPNWSPNAHRVVFVTKGKGRVQVAHPDGRNALDLELEDGDLFVIPRFFPVILIADDSDVLEVVGVSDTSRPMLSFLAGKNSIFAVIPPDVRRAAFNIDEDFERKICTEARKHEAIIFPRREKGGKKRMSKALHDLFGDLKMAFA